jgi:hypothetical protein
MTSEDAFLPLSELEYGEKGHKEEQIVVITIVFMFSLSRSFPLMPTFLLW